MASAAEEQVHVSIFDPQTCIRKGLCTVAKLRASETHRLYFEIHGDKNATTKICFIMGLNNSCFGWDRQVRYFARKPGHAVLVFDNRGVGNSETGPRGLYKTSEMARDVLELLDYVGWTEPRSLCIDGVSMGGMIAQELCLMIPERIVTLVLTSSKAGDRIDFPSLKGLKMFGRILSGTVTPETAIAMIVDVLFPESYLDRPDPDEPSMTKRETTYRDFLRRYHLARKQPFSGRIGQLGAAMGHSVSRGQLEELSKLIPKIGVITGDQDSLINPRRSQDLHNLLPGSELVVIKDGGHALPAQIPDEYNVIVERWFNEGAAASKK